MQIQQFRNAVGYIRCSTDGQFGSDKYGEDFQREKILAYANSNGYNVVKWFVDSASGVKEDRPEFDKILYGDVTNPPFEAVIAFKSDRIARDTKLYFYYLYTPWHRQATKTHLHMCATWRSCQATQAKTSFLSLRADRECRRKRV